MRNEFDYKGVVEDYRLGNRKEATELMCEQLTPLVHKIANKYSFDSSISEDLVQEGYMAIVKGMDNYDPELSQPVTYFSACVSNAVKDYEWKWENNVSRYYSRKIMDVKKAVSEMEVLNYTITYETVSDYMDCDMDEVTETMDLIYSIDQSYSMDEYAMCDYPKVADDYVTLEIQESVADLTAWLESISDKSFEILCKRYGLGDEEKKTRAQVSKDFGITEYQVDKECSTILGNLYRKLCENRIFINYNIEELGNSLFSYCMKKNYTNESKRC